MPLFQPTQSKPPKQLKVALVHDWLTTFGGAERVLLTLCELFPEAPIYTLVYNRENLPQFADQEVHTSFIQKLPWGLKKYRHYLPLMPLAIEQFDFQEYDVVISSSHAVAKGIITRPGTTHICYCHTPMRYAWDLYHAYLAKPQIGGKLSKMMMPLMMHRLRMWDRESADRVDYFVANSENIARRIKKYYQRDATVIYPPVVVDGHKPQGLAREDYYVVLSRLIPQKNVDLVVDAFNQLEAKLVIIGDGGMRKELERRAKSNISFVGFQPDEVVVQYLEKAQGFIFPAEDDFGMTPVEAMALGTPVIALGKGGALESVVAGKTGEFFAEPTAASLKEAVEKFESGRYTRESVRTHALSFDERVFREQMLALVNKVMR